MITYTPAEKVCSVIPNSIFCERGQGQNEASLATNKLTLLYLSANYNYASSWGECVVNDENAPSAKRDPERSIGLYTLGRFFEQSITELEIIEAEEEGRRRLDRRSSARNPASRPPAEQAAEPWPTIWKTNGRTIAKMNAGWADQRVLIRLIGLSLDQDRLGGLPPLRSRGGSEMRAIHLRRRRSYATQPVIVEHRRSRRRSSNRSESAA